MADAALDEEVDKGEVTEQGFVRTFESFPWQEQIEISNNLKVQSPTLSVHDHSLKQTLWISMSGSKAVGYGYILGITKSQQGGTTDVGTIVRTQKKEEVIRIIDAFFARTPNMEIFIRTIK